MGPEIRNIQVFDYQIGVAISSKLVADVLSKSRTIVSYL